MSIDLDDLMKEVAQYIIFGDENVPYTYRKEEIVRNEYITEKIVQLDKNITDVNIIFKKFQRIFKENYYRLSVNEIFYRQAKFLENFEDDYVVREKFRESYRNYEINKTYISFSLRDFRTYFSWRTNIRKGIFEKIDWGFDFIYINELLNKIGCEDAEDAINKLIRFWTGYRMCTLKLDNIMPDIIKEFYIINTINIPYEKIVEKYPIIVKSISKDLKDIKKGIYANKIQFFNDISTYKIAKSKLLETKYGYVLDDCALRVFTRLHVELEKNNISLPDMLVCKNMTERWWRPLDRYNVYEMELTDKEIIVEGTEKYELRNGTWSRTTYSAQHKYKNTLGYILKTMEYYIRDYVGYNKLKLQNQEEILKDVYQWYCTNEEIGMLQKIYRMDLETIIQNETLKYLYSSKIPKDAFRKKKTKQDEFEQEEKIEVVFNQEQFAKIREKSEQIQKALVIEEIVGEENEVNYKIVAKTLEDNGETQIKNKNEETNNILQIKTIAENKELNNIKEQNEITNVFKTFVCDLTQTEKEVIQVLLQKQDVENKMLQIAQTQNEMLEVMVSNINDKALETIGDTIIESNMTSIYEDYENEIKQVI